MPYRPAQAPQRGDRDRMAAGTLPVVKKIPADQFVRLLSGAEIALGGALLVRSSPPGSPEPH